MRLTCPACGACASLDVLIGHQGARDAVIAALKLPAQLGELLIQYVALFRPPQRQLSFDRLSRLLTELQPMIAEARIERGGRSWPAPLEYWRFALEDMVSKRDKLTLPLKSHGYLLEIIAGLANKAEGQAERTTENRLAGRTPNAQPASHDDAKLPPPVEKRSVMPEHVKQALKGGQP